MSPRAAAEFSKQWPALERRLNAFLRSKGVRSSDVDDLVQEVATRLLAFWNKIDRSKPLWPLVVTIALNLVRDRGRRPDLEVLGDLPDVAGFDDAADAGIARLELAAVVRAMEALTPSQRAALLQVVDPEGVRSTSADKMLRLRARRRLANAVGRACAGVALKFRRIADGFQAFFSKAEGVASAVACATCLFVGGPGAVGLQQTFEGFALERGTGATSGPALTQGQSAKLLLASGTVGLQDAGSLRPDRAAFMNERRPARGGSTASGTKGTQAGSTTSGRGASSALADEDNLPSSAPLPEPPSPPDPPSVPEVPEGPDQPTPPDVDPDTPDGPPVSPPSDAPLPDVQQVAEDVVENVAD